LEHPAKERAERHRNGGSPGLISLLVTVDLVLTVSHRLFLQAKDPSLDLATLSARAIQVLHGWAKRIESEGLAVSLSAIAENALASLSVSVNAQELAEIGDRLIDSAIQIESLLSLERMQQSLKRVVLPELENAANSGSEIPWGKAAREITGLKSNVTRASKRLQQLCHALLIWDDPARGSAYCKLLSDGAAGKAPALPERLVAKLKERFPREKELLRSTQRKKT
jgi:hypothetical protein